MPRVNRGDGSEGFLKVQEKVTGEENEGYNGHYSGKQADYREKRY